MKGYGKAVREVLTKAGCNSSGRAAVIMSFGRARTHSKPFTVPGTILSRHTANKVLKDAGLSKEF